MPLPKGLGMDEIDRLTISKYTKDYYIGSVRISSVIGSKLGLGAYPGPE